MSKRRIMCNQGEGLCSHLYPGLVLISKAQVSGERLQDHWSSGYFMLGANIGSLLYGDLP